MIGETARAIIALERTALDRWRRGDPSGFLEICASDVAYFDSFAPRRRDGLAALTAYYESLRGTIGAARWEMVNPEVNVIGGAAVLTFNFVSWSAKGDRSLWNCTEVYRRAPETQYPAWQIVQTHWSFAAMPPTSRQ